MNAENLALLASGDPVAWLSLLMQGGLVPWLLLIYFAGSKLAKWARPLVEAYLLAHIDMVKKVSSTQEELTALLRTVDARLARLEAQR